MNMGQMKGVPKSPQNIQSEREAVKQGLEEMSVVGLDGLDEDLALVTHQELLTCPVEKMYPKKNINWDATVRIINRLTNELVPKSFVDADRIDFSLAYISPDSAGGRKVEASGNQGVHRGDSTYDWVMYNEKDLNLVEFTSASSGSRLILRKEGVDWTVHYIPPADPEDGETKENHDSWNRPLVEREKSETVDRFYQGRYFDLYTLGGATGSINPRTWDLSEGERMARSIVGLEDFTKDVLPKILLNLFERVSKTERDALAISTDIYSERANSIDSLKELVNTLKSVNTEKVTDKVFYGRNVFDLAVQSLIKNIEHAIEIYESNKTGSYNEEGISSDIRSNLLEATSNYFKYRDMMY